MRKPRLTPEERLTKEKNKIYKKMTKEIKYALDAIIYDEDFSIYEEKYTEDSIEDIRFLADVYVNASYVERDEHGRPTLNGLIWYSNLYPRFSTTQYALLLNDSPSHIGQLLFKNRDLFYNHDIEDTRAITDMKLIDIIGLTRINILIRENLYNKDFNYRDYFKWNVFSTELRPIFLDNLESVLGKELYNTVKEATDTGKIFEYQTLKDSCSNLDIPRVAAEFYLEKVGLNYNENRQSRKRYKYQ